MRLLGDLGFPAEQEAQPGQTTNTGIEVAECP